MCQRTFSDTLIRLEAFKTIFVLRPKLDFFPRGRSNVFDQKRPNFKVSILDLFMSPLISACPKHPLGIIFKCK